MVRNIEAALGGMTLQSTQSRKDAAKKDGARKNGAKKEEGRKSRSGGRLVRVAEGIR
jgi:hypothetical protein